MAKRFTVTDTGERISDTEVYCVKRGSEEVYVWRQADGVCRCCECSGPLTAMSASCEHARAVKRATAGVRPAEAPSLRDVIEGELMTYRCQHLQDDLGDNSMLVDVLSAGSATIEQGRTEIQALADEIACAIERRGSAGNAGVELLARGKDLGQLDHQLAPVRSDVQAQDDDGSAGERTSRSNEFANVHDRSVEPSTARGNAGVQGTGSAASVEQGFPGRADALDALSKREDEGKY